MSKTFVERVSELLVGKTVVSVKEVSTPAYHGSDECISEGIQLELNDGTYVTVSTDYEDSDFLVYGCDEYGEPNEAIVESR